MGRINSVLKAIIRLIHNIRDYRELSKTEVLDQEEYLLRHPEMETLNDSIVIKPEIQAKKDDREIIKEGDKEFKFTDTFKHHIPDEVCVPPTGQLIEEEDSLLTKLEVDEKALDEIFKSHLIEGVLKHATHEECITKIKEITDEIEKKVFERNLHTVGLTIDEITKFQEELYKSIFKNIDELPVNDMLKEYCRAIEDACSNRNNFTFKQSLIKHHIVKMLRIWNVSFSDVTKTLNDWEYYINMYPTEDKLYKQLEDSLNPGFCNGVPIEVFTEEELKAHYIKFEKGGSVVYPDLEETAPEKYGRRRSYSGLSGISGVLGISGLSHSPTHSLDGTPKVSYPSKTDTQIVKKEKKSKKKNAKSKPASIKKKPTKPRTKKKP